jgi:RNA polymerase sigma-70 factor (ECF subfamily)
MIMDPAQEQIIDRCRAGDEAAFEQVVVRYGPQILKTARLIVRDPALAEDVCQETFIRAWRHIGTLRDEDPRHWLTRIATNMSISAWRRRHRFEGLVERFTRLRPEGRSNDSEQRLDLARALDRLAVPQRAAVILHYYQDLSIEETARVLRTSPHTVKSRLKAALRRLRELTGAPEEWK